MKLLYTVVLVLTGLTSKAQDVFFYSSDRLSSANVTCFCQDGNGYVWIGTQYGLNKFDGYNFTVYLNDPENPEKSLNDNTVTSLFVDSGDTLWIGTRNGICYYNREKDSIFPAAYQKRMPRTECFCQLDNGKLLCGTSSFGIYEIDRKNLTSQRIKDYSVEDNDDFYYTIFQDSHKRIWKTDNNRIISCFPAEGKKLIFRQESHLGRPVKFFENDGKIFIVCSDGIIIYEDGVVSNIPLENYGITSALELGNGNCLLGTQTKGILRGQISGGNFSISDTYVASASVAALFKDRAKNLWVACQNKGVIFISAGQSKFSIWNIPGKDYTDFSTINSAVMTPKGTIWCCMSDKKAIETDLHGNVIQRVENKECMSVIYCATNGRMFSADKKTVYEFNPENGSASPLKTNLDCDKIAALVENDGQLYVARQGKGLEIIDLKTLKSENHNMYQTDRTRGVLCNDWINDMFFDGGLLYLATISGVTCYDPVSKKFSIGGKNQFLGDINCTCLEKISSSVTAIGTEKGLYMYNSDQGTVEKFPNSSPLDGISIKKILKNDGDLWISSSNGIWHYKHKENIFIPYISGDGLSGKEYADNVGIMISPELAVFGNSRGFAAFNPNSDRLETVRPGRPVLTDVYVSGKKICGKQKYSPVLEYRDNSLVMNFSVFDYATTQNMSFEYSLDGKTAVKLPAGENSVMLYNLSAGKYKMRIRALSNSGNKSEIEIFTITVKQPWYNSIVANIIYIIILISVIIYIIVRVKKIKEQKDYEEKTQFLINATHDIRTPLTMIISPLNQLLKEEKTEEKRRRLLTISRNADKILDLINQILYLRKIDKQQAGILCRRTDLSEYILRSVKLYEETAKERDIDFSFTPKVKYAEAYIDVDNFDKVINNLISNAFKYTPDGGKITVELSETEETALIEVKDTGQGLDENDIKNIFTRFYQSSSRPEMKTEGTGIGLNICKTIVEKHHGSISARNREDSQGSVFSVTIPLGFEHLKPEEIAEENIPMPEKTTAKNAASSSKILLVDDSEDICQYIISELSQFYKFSVCHNGKEAVKILMEEDTDLVISDIMMPVMDGLTLLRMIKTNGKTNHIPVILLSGQSEIANRLEGLSRGADGFIAKPFIIEELNVMIKNLLKKNSVLKGKFSGNQEFLQQNVKDVKVSNPDKEIVEKVIKNINENLADPDFNVTALAENIGVSRVHLHRKLKDFAGINASDLIRNIRLEQAGRMLKETSNTISQIAYAVGFNNVGHFSKIFKQHFGITPKDYAKSQNEKDTENDA
jgi:signal transduction histidine kinase/DNA-binding response OmpR family regulator/ligand-binding sensor domain-containing protein